MIPVTVICAALIAFAPPQAKPAPTPTPAPKAAELEIRVLEEQGRPLPEATVRVFAQPMRILLTDSEGIARVPDLKPGSYRVNAAKGGFRLAETTVTVPQAQPAPLEFRLKPEA